MEDAILTGKDWDDLPNVVHVDVGIESPEGHQSPKYHIDIDPNANRDCRVCVLFPTHPVPKYKMLWTDDYRNIRTLQKVINQRLGEARGAGNLVMGVALQNTLFVIEGIKGTGYLVWANTVTCININNVETIPYEHVPIFVEMDRYGSYRSVFVFPKQKDPHRENRMTTLHVQNFELFEPHVFNIFCMEADPRKESDVRINTMTHDEAEEMVKSAVDKTLVSMDHEEGPYPYDDDDN